MNLQDFLNIKWITKSPKNKFIINRTATIKNEIEKFLIINNIQTKPLIAGLYQYINKVDPKCLVCNKLTKFISFTEGFRKHCSNKCVAQSNNVKNKRIQTNLFKYGQSIPSKNKSIGNKISQTKQKTTPEQKLKIQELKQITSLKNCGAEHHMKNKCFVKKFKTIYSNKSAAEKLEIINRIRLTNLNKSAEEKLEIINRIRLTNLNKSAEEKLEIINRTNSTKNKNTFIRRKTYIENETYIKNNKFNIERFMSDNNICKSNANKIKKQFNIIEPNITKRYKTQSEIFDFIKIENKLWNNKTILNGLELDIVLPDFNLAIEYNGLMFHSSGISKYSMFNKQFDKNYHLNKTIKCNENNLKLFHIFENEWLDEKKQLIWKSMINNELGLSFKTYARKCKIVELNFKTVNNFLNKNHLQGSVKSNINIGLKFDDELLCIATFCKSRLSKKYEYELLRMCNKTNNIVVGGFSKLLKYFEKVYKPKSLVSYANKRFSTGNVYYQNNFKYSHESAPNYFYFKPAEYLLYSRNKFQKHKLEKQLKIFNKTLTETENMYNNDYRKIYDCGNIIFYKEYKY